MDRYFIKGAKNILLFCCSTREQRGLLSYSLWCLRILSDFFFTHLAVSMHLRNNTFRVYPNLNVPHDGSTLAKNANHCCRPPVETERSREGSGCSLEPPAPEAVQSGRRGGAETSGPDESEEDSDGPLQHAAGQRAAGGVSSHSKVVTHKDLYNNIKNNHSNFFVRHLL